MTLRQFFQKGRRCGVGDGKSINFWHDNWVINQPLINFARNIENIDKTVSFSNFINNRGEWNRHKIQHEVATHIDQDYINQILHILIPKNIRDDRLY